jgi:hypothetical protein
LRHFEAGLVREAHHFAPKDRQSNRAAIELLASFEQRLVANTNAEERPARSDVLFDGFEQFLLAHGIDAIVESPDAGQHHAVGVAHSGG